MSIPTPLTTIGIIVAGAMVSVPVLLDGVQAILSPKVRMSVASLEYRGGEFHQHIQVTGGPVQANWAAKISRPMPDGSESFLCVGSGRAPYDGTPSPAMTPDFWTGDNCPELQPGDHALASWEYQDHNGTIHRISAEIVLK